MHAITCPCFLSLLLQLHFRHLWSRAWQKLRVSDCAPLFVSRKGMSFFTFYFGMMEMLYSPLQLNAHFCWCIDLASHHYSQCSAIIFERRSNSFVAIHGSKPVWINSHTGNTWKICIYVFERILPLNRGVMTHSLKKTKTKHKTLFFFFF